MKSWTRIAAFGLVALLATTVSARWIIVNTGADLQGVDALGNISVAQGTTNGIGKYFGETRTGYAIFIARGRVTNLSGRPQIYTNFGCTVADGRNGVFQPATSSVHAVSAHRGVGRAFCSQVCVYNPWL